MPVSLFNTPLCAFLCDRQSLVNYMYNRRLSLSDSEIDGSSSGVIAVAAAALAAKRASLERHSHFFSQSSQPSHARSFPSLLLDGHIEVPEVSIESEEIEDEKEPTFSFDNRAGLAHDLTFLAGLPELCDVTFLVGEDRQPVCGVRAILAARSR